MTQHRHDTIDKAGSVTLRINGRLHHIGVGRTYARTDTILLVQDLHATIIDAATGEILRDLIINPRRDYQPTGGRQDQQENRPNLQNAGPTYSDVLRHRMVLLREQLSSFPRPLERALRKLEKQSGQRRRPDIAHFTLERPNHKLQPNELAGLVVDYQAGVSIKGLGRKYDLHEQTVRAHLERQHIEIRLAAALDDAQIPCIVEQYLAGRSLRELGRQYGVAANSVRSRLLAAGVELRPPVRMKRQAASE